MAFKVHDVTRRVKINLPDRDSSRYLPEKLGENKDDTPYCESLSKKIIKKLNKYFK